MYITQLIETFTVWGMNVHPMGIECLWGECAGQLQKKQLNVYEVDGYWPQLKHGTCYRMGNKKGYWEGEVNG